MSSFRVGEQPEWANAQPASVPPPDFLEQLLSEEPEKSLLLRGYCLLRLNPEQKEAYTNFLESFQCFSAQDDTSKAQFALMQFEQAKHSPNQYHGFSQVAGLKEQFMMRIGGAGTVLPCPNTFGDRGVDLFIKLDQLARGVVSKSMDMMDLRKERLDDVLDPVSDNRSVSQGDNGSVTTGYLPRDYISSSIMDCFHYRKLWRTAAEEGGQAQTHSTDHTGTQAQFLNNHASHTDSGLLTGVVCSDVPALEVLDQQLGVWVALEALLHKRFPNGLHRDYCMFFWGDSCVYLTDIAARQAVDLPAPTPCLHRVEKADRERFSVVFKQRTSPMATAPRYQEDYPLALLQLNALNKHRATTSADVGDGVGQLSTEQAGRVGLGREEGQVGSSSPLIRVVRVLMRLIERVKEEFPSWLAWKLLDTLFALLMFLSLKHASKQGSAFLETWYGRLGW